MKKESQFNGFANILKPVGLTASDVVVKLKRITNSKVGHLGTLDPGASGVLPISIGKATKLFDYLVFKTKKYRACFTFGQTTDTLDSYGVVTGNSDLIPSYDDVKKATNQFCGEISQYPPQYSALSVNGVRAYKMARNGEYVDLKARVVNVYDYQCIKQIDENTFMFDITCSGGTYIRSLARDIGLTLNSVAYMSSLIRLSSGIFDIDNAFTIEEFAENVKKNILPITFPLSNLERVDIATDKYFQMQNGVKIDFDFPENNYYLIYCNNEFFGLGKSVQGKLELEYNLHL